MGVHESLDRREARPAALSREAASLRLFLVAAGVSFLLSVSLWFSGNELQGIFVGLWVPSILALGSLVLPRRTAR